MNRPRIFDPDNRLVGVKYDAAGRPRMRGLLHPKAYLWVINEAFDGGLHPIPFRLEKLFWDSVKVWRWEPVMAEYQAWEYVHYERTLRQLLGDAWEKRLREESEGDVGE